MPIHAGSYKAILWLIDAIYPNQMYGVFGKFTPYIGYHECSPHNIKRRYFVCNVYQPQIRYPPYQRALKCAYVKILRAKVGGKGNHNGNNKMELRAIQKCIPAYRVRMINWINFPLKKL